MNEQDQQFVEYVLKSIVDKPDDVKVERSIDEMGVLISVSVNPDDMGKVIGKSGQTAKAIRTLLKVVGAKNDARVNMKIIEPEGGRPAVPTGTEAVDDEAGAPVSPADDPAAVNDAAQHQQVTDAAVPQPSDDDAVVDEATGEEQAEEPASVEEAPADTKTDDSLHERSPLDDL